MVGKQACSPYEKQFRNAGKNKDETMANYRRLYTPGACYFFTLIAYRRQPIFCDALFRNALRQAIVQTRIKHPFAINAWVLLPDHLHTI